MDKLVEISAQAVGGEDALRTLRAAASQGALSFAIAALVAAPLVLIALLGLGLR
jgi:hypothetical protein